MVFPGSLDNTIWIWNLGSGACDRVLEGHTWVREGDSCVYRVYEWMMIMIIIINMWICVVVFIHVSHTSYLQYTIRFIIISINIAKSRLYIVVCWVSGRAAWRSPGLRVMGWDDPGLGPGQRDLWPGAGGTYRCKIGWWTWNVYISEYICAYVG